MISDLKGVVASPCQEDTRSLFVTGDEIGNGASAEKQCR